MKPTRLAAPVVLGVSALLCAALPAQAAGSPVTTVVSGLSGPLHLSMTDHTLYIADTFGGKVLTADPATGRTKVLATGVNVSAVSVGQNGAVYVSVAAGAPHVTPALARLVKGSTVQVADLLAYEKAHNPDGQPQQTGKNADALSNPYDVLAQPGRELVADAAGNDVLSVDGTGRVRLLTVLPVSKVGSCAHATNNGVKNGGCDPVPTGLATGADGYLYVSGLGAEVAGHVWKVDPATGTIVAQYDGFPPLTGIAAGPGGGLYVSSLFTNTIYRLSRAGKVTGTVSVTGPTGMQVMGGQLYAGSVHIPKKGAPTGSVVRIPISAFAAAAG